MAAKKAKQIKAAGPRSPKQRETDKIRFSIGAKLITIITIIVLISLGSITVLVSWLFRDDLQTTAEAKNYDVNRKSAIEAEFTLTKTRSESAILMQALEAIGTGSAAAQTASQNTVQYYFSQNPLVAALVFNIAGKPGQLLINEDFFRSRGIETTLVNAWQGKRGEALRRGEAGENVLFNEAPGFAITPLISFFFPWEKGGGGVLFLPENLDKSFGSGTNQSCLINSAGDILIFADSELVQAGENAAKWEFIRKIRESSELEKQELMEADFSFGRTALPAAATGKAAGANVSAANADGMKENTVRRFWDSLKQDWNSLKQTILSKNNTTRYFIAFNKLNIGACVVITGIEYNKVFEGIDATTRRNIYLTLMVLFISILFIWFFSKTISTPLKSLAEVTRKIEGGAFEVDMQYKGRDEIGVLTAGFQRMCTALNIFGRFTNKDIAVRAMRGEIKPGGLPRHATIFFSDIRSFTEKSENFTKTFGDEASNRIVLWLNDYFTHMVECVEKTDGVVDKFIGDAVMAHWGTASTAGSPARDAFNCVKAALMMRKALYGMNKNRKPGDPGDPPIRIGCGINTGIVTAGQIGSDLRMEYTAIGDPVNLASRAEALNKPLGTDILITEDTWELVNEFFITEEMPSVTVKGKQKPVRLFAVVNFAGVTRGPQTLSEVRSHLGIEAPDLSKVDLDEGEKKYKIAGKG